MTYEQLVEHLVGKGLAAADEERLHVAARLEIKLRAQFAQHVATK